MRGKWNLLGEEDLQQSGHEWLLQLIDNIDVETAGRLVLLWRAWFVRNELTHSNQKLSIQGSVGFLTNYWESLFSIRQNGMPVNDKGKKPVFVDTTLEADRKHKEIRNWESPQSGKIKVSVDGAFV
jgi:hypothetical protein